MSLNKETTFGEDQASEENVKLVFCDGKSKDSVELVTEAELDEQFSFYDSSESNRTTINKAEQEKGLKHQWMLMALISGITSGVGNFLLGAKLSHVGAMGAGFTGPLNLVILLVYRFGTIFMTKQKLNTWVDKENSNFFQKTTHKFLYQHLIPLAGNFIPNLVSLVFIAITFKLCEEAGINQGIMMTFLSLASVYNTILFRITFDERIAAMHYVGMGIMILAVIFLTIEAGKRGEEISIGQVNTKSSSAGIKAVILGVCTPALFTVKAFCIRSYPEYNPWDLGVDALIIEHLCYVCMYLSFIAKSAQGFVLEDFLYGQVIGLLYLVGKLSLTLAYAFGPGGPVNTLSTIQSIVQTLMDSLIMGQSLDTWGILGLCLGVFGTFVISMGNSIWRYIFGHSEKSTAGVAWSPKGRLG